MTVCRRGQTEGAAEMDISIVLSKSIQTLLPSDIQRNETAMCNWLMKLYMYILFTYEHICMYICMYVHMYMDGSL